MSAKVDLLDYDGIQVKYKNCSLEQRKKMITPLERFLVKWGPSKVGQEKEFFQDLQAAVDWAVKEYGD